MHLGNVHSYYGDNAEKIVRDSMMEPMTMAIGGITRQPLTLKEELILASQAYANAVPDLHIALAGGWDSNVCLHTFVEAGLKPNVVIIKFPDNLNDFDVLPARERCKFYGIEPRIIEIDNFSDFLKDRLVPAAERYQTYTFFQTLLAVSLEEAKINCLLVDKVDLRRDMNPNRLWSFIRSEVAGWTDRFNLVNDHKIYMNYYCYSAEAMTAYLRLPVIEQLMASPMSGKLSLQSLKHKIYKEGGYTDLPLLTRTVSTDKVIALNSLCEDIIRREVGWRCRLAYVEYDRLLDGLENKGTQKWQYIL